MRITNRLLESDVRRTAATATIALALVTAAASCSTTTSTLTATDESNDASSDEGTDAGESHLDAAVSDDTEETSTPLVDAATSDAGPLPIHCVDPPCAKSLVNAPVKGFGFCALLDGGTVACWGGGTATPKLVPGLVDIVRLAHTCAIDKDGAAWCWGTGPFLQTTTRAYSIVNTPVKIPIPSASRVDFVYDGSFGAPFSAGCAVVEDDQIVCWGMNANGQVHPPTLTESATAANPVTTVSVSAGAEIQDIFVGQATFLLRTDGTLLSWGANATLGRVSSLSPDPRPRPLALTGVTYVAAEGGNACVVAQGSVYCWGMTVSSYGSTLSNATPRQIALPELAVAVDTTGSPYGSGVSNPNRACAVVLSGDVYCWGSNSSGQAGDGTREFPLAPVKVQGLPAPASIVRTSALATCALLTTGKVYCWGENGYGELGNGEYQEPSLTPVEVLLPE